MYLALTFCDLLSEPPSHLCFSRFFVAIHPARQPGRSRQMCALVKPGGYLIALVWPIANQPSYLRLPFLVQLEHYINACGENCNRCLAR